MFFVEVIKENSRKKEIEEGRINYYREKMD